MRILFTLFLLLGQATFILGQKQEVNKFISSFTKENNFSGTILIQKDSSIIYKKSYGLADIQFNVPNKINTKYKIASVTKAFTSVLILQLYQEGKIDLNKTIKTYLPEYKGEAGAKATILELLHHTSGMLNMDTIKSQKEAMRDGMPAYQLPHTINELIDKYCSGPLVHKPGKVFDYDNAEYIILGKIIETIYGMPYKQVLRQQILQPLKMNNSGIDYQYKIIKNLSRTYFVRNDIEKLVNDMPAYIENWYASGAMYSTVGDLLKFSNALFDHKLLNKNALNIMLTPGLGDYGCGVWIYKENFNGREYTVIKRPGRIMGAEAELYHFLSPDLTIIILSNTDAADLDNFVWQIGKRLVE